MAGVREVAVREAEVQERLYLPCQCGVNKRELAPYLAVSGLDTFQLVGWNLHHHQLPATRK